MAKRISIKRRFLFFSAMLFLAIFAIGTMAFVVSMQGIIHESKRNELQQITRIERLQLEAIVNGEIAIVLKMANSPLIQRYFANPTDPELEQSAFEEIGGYRRALTNGTMFWVNDIDKKFYSDSTYAYTVDTKDPKNYWYEMTLNETEKYNFNINHNPDLGNTNLWINAPVFDKKRKPVGILGAGVDLGTFIQFVYKNYTGEASFYFFNKAGEITGANDLKLVSNKTLIGKLLGKEGDRILQISKTIKAGAIENFTTPAAEYAISAVPVLDWYIVTVYPINTQDYLKTNMSVIYLATVIVIAFIFIIFNIFISKIMQPLKTVVKTLKAASNNWDLTQRIEAQPKNEIGDIAYSFNKLMESLRSPIAGAKTVTDSFTSTSQELTDISGQLTSSSQNMVDQSVAMTKINEQMTANINAMASDTEEASASSKQVADVAEMMSSNMNIMSSTIGEMSSNINQIANNAEIAHSVAAKAAEKSSEATDAMNKLGIAAKEIGQVTDVIKKIADKTNLLALNATIEAASAGEAGKGFAVVASEIKELANQSATSADDIARRIDGIQSGVNNAIDVIGNVANIIVEINKSVETIAANVEQQTKSSNEVSNNISQTDVCTKMVSNAISQVANIATAVSKNAGDVSAGAGDVSKNISNMSDSAKESALCASRVSESVDKLHKMSEDLKEAVAKFIV